MPGFDGTGPMGQGAMTGRGLGNCLGYAAPGSTNIQPTRTFQGWGGGRGMGRGAGRGRRNQFYATGMTGWQRAAQGMQVFGATVPAETKQQQLDTLKGQAEYFEDVLNGIRQQIEQLES
jgi:uncharacterized protein DUF5320